MWSLPTFDLATAQRAQARQAALTKPAGSLGTFEQIAIQLAGFQGSDTPVGRPAAALLFAADHPVAVHGVSAYPAEVTAAMVQNFVRGGAAASVLCRKLGVPLRVVDVGVAHPYDASNAADGVSFRRADVATLDAGDIRTEDAMPPEVYECALAAGAREVDELPGDTRILVLGDMGIGNTTVAAAVATALIGCDAADIVGAGTGVAGDVLTRKLAVVHDAAGRARGREPHDIVRITGGREIAGLIGAAGRALERRIAVLVDGFIVTAAMLALVRMDERARHGLLFAHRSHERGHARLLQALDARPLLDLSMRLGEGSGALSALPLVDLACTLHNEMATFDEAAVPGPVED